MSDMFAKTYPRGVPFKPPQTLADREARLRRWTYCLLGGAAMLFLCVATAGVFFLKAFQVPASAAPTDPPAGEPGSIAKRTGPSSTVDGKGPAGKKSAEPGENTRKKKSKPPSRAALVHRQKKAGSSDPANEEEKTTAVSGKAQREFYLKTMAVLTVGHLYQGYLNIGLLADGREGGAFEKAEAVQTLAEVTNTLQIVDRQLAKLLEHGLDPEDQKDVQHVRKLSGLLKVQARELKAYWDDPDEEQKRKYRKAREAAWAGIERLLEGDEGESK
jgi:hypothetical protein